jgi:hypothetical protein
VTTGSRDINSSTLAAAQASSIHPVIFAKLEFDDGTVNVHTELGDITWGGDTYTGVGKIGSIGTAEEVSDLSLTNIALGLSGLPTDLVSAFFNQKYKGRRATIYLGYLSLTTRVLVDTPTILYRGIMDKPDFVRGKTFSITLTIANRFAKWNSAVVRRYNNADQQNRYPGDKGLEFIERNTNKTLIWGASK